MRETILSLIKTIQPFDELENTHCQSAIDWIQSGAEIFRIEKPATPPRHLVSYVVLVDFNRKKILLVDHIKARLWLPTGGHVEKDEHPNATVEREAQEELNILADFKIQTPFFITETVTVGLTAGHMDVSLWYMLNGDSGKVLTYDPQEFNGYRWFDFEEILKTDPTKLDPHMQRFTRKLLASTFAG
jgi:8-oxo-dGTP diphosphatase